LSRFCHWQGSHEKGRADITPRKANANLKEAVLRVQGWVENALIKGYTIIKKGAHPSYAFREGGGFRAGAAGGAQRVLYRQGLGDVRINRQFGNER